MKYNWKGLLLWFSIFYFVGGNIRDIILNGSSDIFESKSAKEFLWIINSFVVFFLFSLLGYTALYKAYPKKKWLSIILFLLIAVLLPIPLRFFLDQILSLTLVASTNYNIDTTFFSFGRHILIFG